MTYRIREVDCSDDDVAELIHELHEATFGDTAPKVNPARGWWWVAYDGREVAGFCGLTPTYRDASIGYLKRAGVLYRHRGQGLQRRFVRVREAKARRVGMRSIITDTTDNPSSSNNLIACGYRIFRPPSPWAFPETIYWHKELSH